MLPFLKPKRQTGLIVAQRKPDGGKEELYEEGNENAGLEACAEDLIRAIHAKDTNGVAKAFKDAFDLCESQPHEEFDHEQEESE